MQEFEDQELGTFDPQFYLGVVRRRHLHFLIPLLLGWIAVWSVSWILPPRYKSSTLILVEQPSMPSNYVTPNVTDNLQERLQSITQQILSRTRLLQIVNSANLYTAGQGKVTPDDLVERLRKDIQIELVRDNQNRISAFNVYYTAADPHTAQRVTSDLTNLFINENLESRQQQSEGTTKFLEDQLESARQTLSQQEEKIRVFKAQHVAELPTQLQANLQILSGLQSQLQSQQDALNSAKQQRIYLQSLVDQYHSLQPTGKGGDDSPAGLPAIDQELDRLKSQLTDLNSRYTDSHPDVRKVKSQIAKTEKVRDNLIAELKNKSAGSSSTPVVTDPSHPSPLAQLQSQLQANSAEIANRERAISEITNRINDYQGRLNQEPVREQELADLTRGYDQSKANYDDLLKKKNESAMATSMELMQQGERFRIIDPPSLPQKPDFPNRLKFCGIGLGVGLALGVVIAGAFELLDAKVYDEKALKDMLPVPVISEIPVVSTPADEHREKRRIWIGWATAATVFGVILVGSAISYLRG